MKNLSATVVSIGLSFLIGLTLSACQEPELAPSKPGLLVPRTVDQDASLPQLSVNSTTLHVETFGDPTNPLLVVLHGGPGGDYRSMLKAKAFASDGYYVIFYDQRGSGLSRRHPEDHFNMDVMIADLGAVIAHYRTSPEQKTFLVGLSWGAMLATAYIDQHPSDIAGAILAEPGGFTWEDAKDYLSRTRKWKPFQESVNDVFYPDQFFTGREDQHEILDYKFALTTAHDFAKGNALGNAGPAPFWRYGAVAQDGLFKIADKEGFDFTTHLYQYTNKILFLYSERNAAYGPHHAQLVSSAFPNAQLTLIEGTGHEILWFGWENFYPAAIDYLNTLK